VRSKSTLVMLLSAIVILVLGFAVAVYAADGVPWADLEIEVGGGIVLYWLGIQMAIVQALKSIEINGKRIVEGKTRTLLANAVIGGIGLVLAAVIAGTPFWPALVSAITATLASVGLWEHVEGAVGKSPGKNSPASM